MVFVWDSRGDSVGLASTALGVLVQVVVDDGVSPCTGSCTTATFDVDNTALCVGFCGDCDLNGASPNIIGALTAAQFAVGIGVPSLAQMNCCDINSSTTIDVIDALAMAQDAVGLMPTLNCP